MSLIFLDSAERTADLATGMILGLIRNTAYYDREIRRKMAEVPISSSGDVRQMTLGLYGFGAAGRYLHDIFHGGFAGQK